MKKLLSILFIFLFSISIFASDMGNLNPQYEAEINNFKHDFSLFFFSDLHGDREELERYCEFIGENEKYLDDSICTGDMVQLSWDSDYDFFGEVKGSNKILLAIGNHELWHGLAKLETKTNIVPQKDAFNRYFKPFIDNWNVSYSEGYTQYFKDYKDKKIRLIVINTNLDGIEDTAQLSWFERILNGAKDKDYSVIVANHLTNSVNTVPIKCAYTHSKGKYKGQKKMTKYLNAVKEFKDVGGKFICFLGGHVHYNFLSYDEDYKVLAITVGVTDRINRKYVYAKYQNKPLTMNEFKSGKKGKKRDCANILLFDIENKLVKIIPLGFGGKETSFIVDYENNTLAK